MVLLSIGLIGLSMNHNMIRSLSKGRLPKLTIARVLSLILERRQRIGSESTNVFRHEVNGFAIITGGER